MCAGEQFSIAVHKITLKEPAFQHEGMAGYIETEYEIEVANLQTFCNIWNSWYSLSDTRRIQLYGLAKGLGDCK